MALNQWSSVLHHLNREFGPDRLKLPVLVEPYDIIRYSYTLIYTMHSTRSYTIVEVFYRFLSVVLGKDRKGPRGQGEESLLSIIRKLVVRSL